jgi:hypothetical protein
MNKLFEKCREFLKQATELKVSLVENNDPILKQLSELKDFDDRVELAEEHWEKLGTGSARAVFKISDDLIIKIAINKKGVSQIKVEAEFDLQKPCVATVVVADPEGKWLISHFTDTMTHELFKKIIGYGFDNFMSCLFFAYNNESDNWIKEPKSYDEIKNLPLFKCIGAMVVDGNILLGDVGKVSSWGVRNGKVLLRDYGLDKLTYEKFYDDGSAPSSSPPKTSS